MTQLFLSTLASLANLSGTMDFLEKNRYAVAPTDFLFLNFKVIPLSDKLVLDSFMPIPIPPK